MFPGHNPKISCCTLRAIYNRLPTTTRLKQFQIIAMDTSVLCDIEAETNAHLYFSCPYSSYIWTLCRLKLGLNSLAKTLHEEASSIKLNFKKRNKCYFYLEWYYVEQFGTCGRKETEGYSNNKACANFSYSEDYMKISIFCQEPVTRRTLLISVHKLFWVTGHKTNTLDV